MSFWPTSAPANLKAENRLKRSDHPLISVFLAAASTSQQPFPITDAPLLALAGVLGVGKGHLLHRETRAAGSAYYRYERQSQEREPAVMDCKPTAWIASSLAINVSRPHRQSQII